MGRHGEGYFQLAQMNELRLVGDDGPLFKYCLDELPQQMSSLLPDERGGGQEPSGDKWKIIVSAKMLKDLAARKVEISRRSAPLPQQIEKLLEAVKANRLAAENFQQETSLAELWLYNAEGDRVVVASLYPGEHRWQVDELVTLSLAEANFFCDQLEVFGLLHVNA